MTTRAKRILAVASGGGHWVQLSRLAPAWEDCDVTYVTTDSGYRNGAIAVAKVLEQPEPGFFVIKDANRWQKMRLMLTLFQIAAILLRIRPDVVVTTGAAPGYFALRIAALMGIRTVWVDSIANAEELSLAGRKAGRHADFWLTQWEHLAEPDGPEYRGTVL